MNSNNFFQLIADFQKNIDWLNNVLKGNDSETVVIDGIVKPTISKDIADKWNEIKAMVQGRLAFETKASMDASGSHPDNTLSEVWNDPIADNNGLYGYLSGLGWVKSPYDNYQTLFALIDEVDKKSLQRVEHLQMTVTEGTNGDTHNNQLGYAVIDEAGQVALGVNDRGDVLQGHSVCETRKMPEMAWGVQDAYRRTPLGVLKDGSVVLGGIRQLLQDAGTIVWGVSDVHGYLPLAIDEKGRVHTGHMTTEELGAGVAWALCDSEGRMAISVNKNGTVDIPGLNIDIPEPEPEKEDDLSDIIKNDVCHIFTYGQSLSRGSTAYPVISSNQLYSNLTFGEGCLSRGKNDGWQLDTTKLLIEEQMGSEAETPTSGTTENAISRDMNRLGVVSHTELGYIYFGSAPGQGGQPIENLHKDTFRWKGMMEQVNAAKTLSHSASRTYNVTAMTWTQGEANYGRNTSKDSYKSMFKTMVSDFATEVKAITGQTFDPICITYQVAAHRKYSRDHINVAQAQLEAAIEHPRIFLVCPMYAMEYSNDNLHLPATSSKMLGYYYGRVLDLVTNEKLRWEPCRPLNITIQDKFIDIHCHVPSGKLVIDTSWVAEAPNYGFDIWDKEQNSHLDLIESVSLSGSDRIRINLKSTPPEGAILSYAQGRKGDPNVANKDTGPRGNIRDSAGDSETFIGADGQPRRLDNYLVIFNHTLIEEE